MSEIAKARGYGAWMKGKSMSPESIEKMRAVQRAIGNDPMERTHRSQRAKSVGAGKWMKERQSTPETREKIGACSRGKTYAEIYGERALQEAAKRTESNRQRWDGVPRKPQRPKHNADYKYSDWRKAVFERDGYRCQVCDCQGGELQAHHVNSWAKFPLQRFEVGNGLTVHKGKCHREADRQTRQREKNVPRPAAASEVAVEKQARLSQPNTNLL